MKQHAPRCAVDLDQHQRPAVMNQRDIGERLCCAR